MNKTESGNVVEDIGHDFAEAVSHGMIVSELAVLVAEELGMDRGFCRNIAVAGFLHDIGKLKLSEELHFDRSKAMVVEKMKYVRMHSTFSRDILFDNNFEDDICTIVYHHHENNDGSGYPTNISAEDIPVGARIIRVCDVYAALISTRSYREAFSEQMAVQLMIEEAKHFDMKIFLAFMRVIHSESYCKVEKLLERKIEDKVMEYFENDVLQNIMVFDY